MNKQEWLWNLKREMVEVWWQDRLKNFKLLIYLTSSTSVVSTVVSGIPFARFPTVKCILTIFGLSYEDVVEVQQNTMTGEGKSSDNDKTHNNEESNSPLESWLSLSTITFLNNYDVVGESYKILESRSNRFDYKKRTQNGARQYRRDYLNCYSNHHFLIAYFYVVTLFDRKMFFIFIF